MSGRRSEAKKAKASNKPKDMTDEYWDNLLAYFPQLDTPYTKDGQLRVNVKKKIAQRESRLSGRVVEQPWKKGGVEVDIDPVPPPFLRANIRDESYGDGHGARRKGGSLGCKYTKPSLGTRRDSRRLRGKIAKASRKANR